MLSLKFTYGVAIFPKSMVFAGITNSGLTIIVPLYTVCPFTLLEIVRLNCVTILFGSRVTDGLFNVME